MDFVAEIFEEILLRLVIWLVLFPVIWLLATPFIFVLAIFAPMPYWAGVKSYYGCATDIALQLGMSL